MTDGFARQQSASNGAGGASEGWLDGTRKPMGLVVGGSLTQGIEVRLDAQGRTTVEPINDNPGVAVPVDLTYVGQPVLRSVK